MRVPPIPVVAVPVAREPERSGFYALGLLMAYAKKFIDEMSSCFMLLPVKPLGKDDIESFLESININRPAIYLFSVFSWNQQISLGLAERIRELSPDSLIVFGGANIPRREADARRYMDEHPCIDVLGIGEGEATFLDILNTLGRCLQRGLGLRFNDLSSVQGIVFRASDTKVLMTPPRNLLKAIDDIPSPYLSGIYDESIVQLGLVFTETTRGCPFGCTFCDWGGQILSKVRKFDVSRVKQELEYFASAGIAQVGLCDANFGMLSRDIEIAEHVIACKEKYGFPRAFGSSMAKNSHERVFHIYEMLFNAGLHTQFVIALQTLDKSILRNIARENIKVSDYEELLYRFRERNMPVASEFMLGLPGQTYQSFMDDMQQSFDWMITPLVHPVMVMANAPMGDPDYQKQYRIVVDKDGYAISSYSFTEEDRQQMTYFRALYFIFVQQKFFSYMLVYLQIEKGVDASVIIDRALSMLSGSPQAYKDFFWFVGFVIRKLCDDNRDSLIVSWNHEEGVEIDSRLELISLQFIDFCENEFGISVPDEEKASIVSLQLALLRMASRRLPEEIPVPFDVVAYFQQISQFMSLKELPGHFMPLHAFPPGRVIVPQQKTRKRLGFHPVYAINVEFPLQVEGL